MPSCRGRGGGGARREEGKERREGGRGLPGWAWAAAAAYHGSRCISSSLCLLHTGLGLGLRLVLGLGRQPLAPATGPPSRARGAGLTPCWLSLHLSPSGGSGQNQRSTDTRFRAHVTRPSRPASNRNRAPTGRVRRRT